MFAGILWFQVRDMQSSGFIVIQCLEASSLSSKVISSGYVENGVKNIN